VGKSVLLIGSNSFSGSVTRGKLASLGVEVIGVSRSKNLPACYETQNQNQKIILSPNYSLGSNFSADALVDLCNKHDVTSIINFAAQSMVAESWDTPWDWYETNNVWLSKVTSALIKWGKLEKFIHFSTPEVYGDTEGWITEVHPKNPSTPYAISRLAGDLHLLAESKRSGFPLVITRAANVYGPMQRRYRLIPKSLLAAKNGERIDLHGGGKSIRSFIYMEDVAEALFLLLSQGKLGNTYHISTNTLYSVKEVVEMCYRLYNQQDKGLMNVVEDRPGKDAAYRLNSDKIRSDLRWSDKVSFEEGVLLTKQWVDSSYELLMMESKGYVHKP
jgi:dTDP-glucose 4,6-dehydratase